MCSDILPFCGPPKKEQTALWKLHVSGIHDFLKCHRNVTKQTNPLHVDNLIMNKFVAFLEATRILNTHCVKTYVLANVNFFGVNNCINQEQNITWCGVGRHPKYVKGDFESILCHWNCVLFCLLFRKNGSTVGQCINYL